MTIEEYKKLENNISSNSFRDSYKNINIIMFILSILGNIVSIFLAYFLVNKVFSSIIENSPIFTSIVSIILLTGLELLKRDFFDKFSFQYLKNKSFNKNVLPLATVSGIIILMSFYASINGAKEFSSKSEKLELVKDSSITNFSDSLTKISIAKISKIEAEINLKKNKIETKDEEQTNLESNEKLTYTQKNRIKDLKNDKESLKKEIKELNQSITNEKTEKDSLISNFKISQAEKTNNSKDKNSDNSFLFIMISSIIEITILCGVYFNKYYKFKSYSDMREQIENDPNYQKWDLYNKILDVIYTKNLSQGDKLPSSKQLIDICKVNDLKISQKDIINFTKLITSIGILKTSGPARFVQKSKEASMSLLKSHFNIK